MCFMDIMNILRTDMNMSIPRIHISGSIFGSGYGTIRISSLVDVSKDYIQRCHNKNPR